MQNKIFKTETNKNYCIDIEKIDFPSNYNFQFPPKKILAFPI